MSSYDAIVLAGGAAKRLGGVDKPGLDFNGRSALDRVLAALADADHTVVVGPARLTEQMVTWCCENPPGAGPLAALRTGLDFVSAHTVAVLAADLPLLDDGTVQRLVAAAQGHDGAVLVDDQGHDQFLLGAYNAALLRAKAAALPPSASMRRALAGLDLVRVADARHVSLDCDTWDQVREVRSRL